MICVCVCVWGMVEIENVVRIWCAGMRTTALLDGPEYT